MIKMIKKMKKNKDKNTRGSLRARLFVLKPIHKQTTDKKSNVIVSMILESIILPLTSY